MSMSLGQKLAGGAVALSMLFSLAACGESDLDIQRKPELIDLLADRAVATCVLQRDQLDQAPYQSRLRDVLNETKSATLDYFKENGITICLDKRLDDQHNGLFGPYNALGVYYPKDKILTLWDNGKSIDQKSWYQDSAVSKGPRFLEEFAHETFGGFFSDYESVDAVKNPMLAHTYRSGGKYRTTHYEWDALGSPTAKALGHNPPLQTPPVIVLQ